MSVEDWLQAFGDPVGAEALEVPGAKALASFVGTYGAHIAGVSELYRKSEWELIVLDFRTGRPQDSAYSIRRVERVGVLFRHTESMPLIFMLRDDFPDTEHQQLAIEGMPRAICIDDRNWLEARLTWTPAELIQRILSWFKRAAEGRLHDARQPLDPVFFGSPLSFIVSRAVLDGSDGHRLVGVHDDTHRSTIRVRRTRDGAAPGHALEPFFMTAYRVAPEHMRRLQFAPDNLASLAAMLEERGIKLLENLAEEFSGLFGQGNGWAINARFAVILDMPIVGPSGEQQEGTDLRAFVYDRSVGEIAVALGVAMEQRDADEGSEIGYVKAVAQSPVEAEAVRAISMQAAEVHLEFDRDLATQLAGRKKADDRKAVLVGAGSIGSHVSDCLIREGRFRWTVIDPDILLPHNIGRHIFRAPEATKFKANLLAKALSDTLDGDPDNADAITDNVLAQGEVGEKIREALAEAEVIIDATASILAERFLSDNPSQARRISIFFNPLGDAGVLLSEPADRNLSLRDLEAQYLGWLVRKEEFADHLESSGGDYAYTGACRAITNLTSPANVTVLSGLIATGVGSALDEDAGAIRIWKLHDGGNVTAHTYAPEPVLSFSAMAWMVTIDSGLLDRILVLRAERLPVETGGVLLGTVDIPSKRIHVIEALPAPPDSVETRHGFTRGTQGVQDALDNVWERTRGQVRYVGEWHSHPPRSAPLPSAIDLVQIDWLSTLFDMETLPALMLIAADDSLSVILANSEAAPITPDAGTEPTPAGANA